MTRSSIALLCLAAALTGCGVVEVMDPVAICRDQAREEGPAVQVSGAFATTVGGVRDLTPGVGRGRWPDLADGSAAVVCYLDGAVAKSPPGRKPFDRAVIAVAGEHAEQIIAGYRDQMPVEAP